MAHSLGVLSVAHSSKMTYGTRFKDGTYGTSLKIHVAHSLTL